MNKVHWQVKLFRQEHSAWTLICRHKDTGKIGKVLVSTPSLLPPQFKELKRWKEVSLSEIFTAYTPKNKLIPKLPIIWHAVFTQRWGGTVWMWVDGVPGVLAEETPADKCGEGGMLIITQSHCDLMVSRPTGSFTLLFKNTSLPFFCNYPPCFWHGQFKISGCTFFF